MELILQSSISGIVAVPLVSSGDRCTDGWEIEMRQTYSIMLLLCALTIGADETACPPVIAHEYCQAGCNELGRWVAFGTSSPATALLEMPAEQAQTASVLTIAFRPAVVVVRELEAEPVALPEWGWQWEQYDGSNALLHAALDARVNGGRVVQATDGTVLRIFWKPCEGTDDEL